MTKTLTIALTETEMQLLRKSAALDCRRPQEQARYLIRCSLLGMTQPPSNDNAGSIRQDFHAIPVPTP